MSAAPKMEAERDYVAEAALAALEANAGDQVKAARALEEKVRKDSALRKHLLEPLITYACHQAVGIQIRQHRGRVWNGPRAVPKGAGDRAGRLEALAVEMLSSFPLPGGLPLAEATREDLAAAADFYAKQATDMAHKGRWLQLIGQSVPDGKRVRDVLTEDRLRELKKEAA